MSQPIDPDLVDTAFPRMSGELTHLEEKLEPHELGNFDNLIAFDYAPAQRLDSLPHVTIPTIRGLQEFTDSYFSCPLSPPDSPEENPDESHFPFSLTMAAPEKRTKQSPELMPRASTPTASHPFFDWARQRDLDTILWTRDARGQWAESESNLPANPQLLSQPEVLGMLADCDEFSRNIIGATSTYTLVLTAFEDAWVIYGRDELLIMALTKLSNLGLTLARARHYADADSEAVKSETGAPGNAAPGFSVLQKVRRQSPAPESVR